MDTRTLKYISENQLSSYMNNAKWKKLVNELTSRNDFEPLVNIKLIFETENNNSFSLVWWDQVESEGFELIEWMQIKSCDQNANDYTEFVKNGIEKLNIEYEFDNGIFSIYGYKRPNQLF